MKDGQASQFALAYGRTILVSLLLIAALALGSASSSAALPQRQGGTDWATIRLPPQALRAPAGLAGARVGALHPKLDSTMAQLADAARRSAREAIELARRQSLELSDGQVHFSAAIRPSALADVTRAVAELGGQVTKSADKDRAIQGWLPVEALETLAARADVYQIEQPDEAVLAETGSALGAGFTTQALAAMNAAAWHAAGLRGAGVKIGIVDGGFQGYTALLGSELPVSVTVKNFVDGETDEQVDGADVHGTACAEIVHDVAPDATLYLAKVNTWLDLSEAIAWLRDTQHVNVISTSLLWYNQTPGDGTGLFADLVSQARAAGILWTTAAGNDREAHWGGSYYDPENNRVHNFNGTQEVNFFGPGDGTTYEIPAGRVISVYVRWDDWTYVSQDYDLYLLRWNGTSWDTVGGSQTHQNGSPGQKPKESARITTTGDPAAYGFVIVRQNATRDVNLEVFAPKVNRLDELNYPRSLPNLADAPAAITVAALDVDSPYPQEPYSSEGPTNGPGGIAAGGLIKPDIAAYANISTTSYAPYLFFGTSAATPHVAGAAALVKGAYPSYTPDQLQSFLQDHAVDMGASGKDTLFGYGRLYLGAAPARIYLPFVGRDATGKFLP